MRFEEIDTRDAAGAVLAHKHRIGHGATLKKGRILSAADCVALVEAGFPRVTVARLAEGDLTEDDAAHRVAEAAAGPNVQVSPPATGRANAFATARGVLVAPRDRVDAVNLVDEAITIATLPPFSVVEVGAMVFTVKIIPFAVPEPTVARARARASEGGPLAWVAPLRPKRAGLVSTTLPGVPDEVLARGAKSQELRMAYLGGRVVREVRVPHDTASIARAIEAFLSEGLDLVLVLGASAIVDRDDVVPQAIRAVGGAVDHLGMPVDPGNLLLLGHKGATPIVGVPGCARSIRPSGFDGVLERLAADLPITREDLMRMGSGGLLAEIPGRPAARDAIRFEAASRSEDLGAPPAGASASATGSAEDEGDRSRRPDDSGSPGSRADRDKRVAAVILAAGLSRRMGGPNKLLAPIDGAPMIARAVDAFLASKASPVLVVVGHRAAEVRAALADRPVRFVENPDFEEGLGASLRAGIEALDEGLDGALVGLGDMPRVAPAHVDALIDAFDPKGPATIVVPVHDRKRGHPVLWSARHFAEMRKLGGDVGARALLERHRDAVLAVPIDDAAVLLDVDTPEMLAAASAGRATSGPADGTQAVQFSEAADLRRAGRDPKKA